MLVSCPIPSSRLQESLSDLSQAIQVDPSSSLSFNARGLLLERLGLPDQALQDFDAALSLEPHHGGYLRNRGMCHRTLGNYEAAVADFTRWVRGSMGAQSAKASTQGSGMGYDV